MSNSRSSKRLPPAVYEGNPPNCIRVCPIDGTGFCTVGPGVYVEKGDKIVIEFHPKFKHSTCASERMKQVAIAKFKRMLGIEKVVES